MRARLCSLLPGIGIGFLFSVSVMELPALAKDAADVLAGLKGLSASVREERLISGAKKEGKLVYYGSGNVRDNQEVLRGFKKRYPFLKVEYSGGGGSRVVQRTHTEFLAKHYVLDVVNANAFRMPTLLKTGVLGKYISPYHQDLTKELMDPKGLVSPLYTTAIAIAYNTVQVNPQQVPKSYADLLKPKWKGRKMALDTEAHSWFMGILGTMGEKKGLEYARRLAAQGLVRRRGHTLMTQLLVVGEFVIQVESYLHTLIGLKEKGAPVNYVITAPLILRPPSVAALAKKAPHPHAAALFIDYMLSPDGGQKILAGQRRWPSNQKTPTKFNLGEVKVWAPALDKWLPRQAEVLDKFDKIFGARAR
ncbi:MAG: ABC transporter substrate-binding protein [Candidatus Binatia bacterium]